MGMITARIHDDDPTAGGGSVVLSFATVDILP
jgi:hypothetical protein